jgi:hypothetical protein
MNTTIGPGSAMMEQLPTWNLEIVPVSQVLASAVHSYTLLIGSWREGAPKTHLVVWVPTYST